MPLESNKEKSRKMSRDCTRARFQKDRLLCLRGWSKALENNYCIVPRPTARQYCTDRYRWKSLKSRSGKSLRLTARRVQACFKSAVFRITSYVLPRLIPLMPFYCTYEAV